MKSKQERVVRWGVEEGVVREETPDTTQFARAL